MKSNETPKTLQDNFLVSHVSDRVDKTNWVEGELDKVTFTSVSIQIIANQFFSVWRFGNVGLEKKWVGGLDIVVDDVVRENTTLTLR